MPNGNSTYEKRFKELTLNIGRAAVNTLFPYDFEYYAISLELATWDNETIDFFTFPVMPKSIQKSENTRINVKKTSNAVSVINNNSFIPHDISIKGDFGRNFKILLSRSIALTFKGLKYSRESGKFTPESFEEGVLSGLPPQFSPGIKTGYGCVKILQSMIDKSRGEDDKGRPFKLFLYNPTLGENYIVVPTNNPLILNQDENNNNMIWAYTLNLTAIAPLDLSFNKKDIKTSLVNILKSNSIQNSVTKSASGASNFIRKWL